MIIRPYRRTNARIKPVAVFDIETQGLGGKFLLGAYVKSSDRKVMVVTDLQEFLMEVVLTSEGERFDWYAHNGAKYDYLYLVDPRIRRKIVGQGFSIMPISSGGRHHGMKITRGHHCWRLKDSFALTGMSLKDFASVFSTTQKQEMDWDNEEFNPRNRRHLDYLKADVTSTLEGIISYQELFISTFNAPLGWTLAGTSLSAWRQTIPPDKTYHTITCKEERECIQAAYYGGRTIVKGSHVWANVHGYDVNSMYAAMMLEGVPVGNSCRTHSYHPGLPGFYVVAAHSNGSTIPLLPKRDKERPGLVYYPLGSFETTVSSVEIELALENGWSIEVLDGYFWDEIGDPFTTFIEKCRALRMQDYNGPLGILAKNVQNHLYGKLAQSPERTAYRVQIAQPEANSQGPWVPEFLPDKRHIKDIWTQEQVKADAIYMPHWAAWITAKARVFVMRAAIAEGWDRVIYSDTDSLWLLGPARTLKVGREYGEWKETDNSVSMMIVAPKTYMVSDGENSTIRCKGIPRKLVTPALMGKAFAGQETAIEVTVINGMLAVLRDYGISWKQARSITTPKQVDGYTYHPPSRTFEPIFLRKGELQDPQVGIVTKKDDNNGTLEIPDNERHSRQPAVQALG